MRRPPAWSSIAAVRAQGGCTQQLKVRRMESRSFVSCSETHKQKDALSPWHVLRLVFQEWGD